MSNAVLDWKTLPASGLTKTFNMAELTKCALAVRVQKRQHFTDSNSSTLQPRAYQTLTLRCPQNTNFAERRDVVLQPLFQMICSQHSKPNFLFSNLITHPYELEEESRCATVS